MERGIITSFYSKYREDQKMSRQFETDLQRATDRQDWVNKLALKSDFLRRTFRENEEALEKWIYPYVHRQLPLTEELASEFFDNAYDMVCEAESDALLTNEVLKMLREYYKAEGKMSEWTTCTYLLGTTYDDMFNDRSDELAQLFFEEIIHYGEEYVNIESWEVRRRILLSYFNSVKGMRIETNEDRLKLIVAYENAKRFYERPEVVAMDGERFDFTGNLSEIRVNVIRSMFALDSVPTKSILEYVKEELLPANIKWTNYLQETPYVALCFLWYKFHNGDISANRYVELMFLYYRCQDSNINYDRVNLSNEDTYQAKTACMQECFRALGQPYVTLENREQYFEEMLQEYKEFYLEMPYIRNNNLLNRELCSTTELMLRSTYNAVQGIGIIFDVVLPRNAATMIHSVMVGKIASVIIDCLVADSPGMFFNFVGYDSERMVIDQKENIKRFAVQCANIHDLGKAFIYDIVGQQTRRLTEEEYELIKLHPEFGAKLLEDTNFGSRYTDAILGHHKSCDGRHGYPEWFDNTQSDIKIIIDILTLSDCIDAATDMFGRNYEENKFWKPVLTDEIKEDNGSRYNQEIFGLICASEEASDSISYITEEGRMDIYYEIYKKYISNDHSDDVVRVVNVKINKDTDLNAVED